MSVNYIYWCIAVVVTFWVCFCFFEEFFDHSVSYIQCDVGQGDGILILYDTVQILVDVGPNNGAILECLDEFMPFWDKSIELLVLTHFDADHIGNLENVVTKYSIKNVFTGENNQVVLRENSLEPFLEPVKGLMEEDNVDFRFVSAQEMYNLSIFHISVLWPVKDGNNKKNTVNFDAKYQEMSERSVDQQITVDDAKKPDKNSESVVLNIKNGAISVLLTGDIDEYVESQLIDRKLLTEPVNILKVAHHGSHFSSSDEFLSVIRPKIATIGVGENTYGHPHGEILDRLEVNRVEVCRTDTGGNVILKWNMLGNSQIQSKNCLTLDTDDKK